MYKLFFPPPKQHQFLERKADLTYRLTDLFFLFLFFLSIVVQSSFFEMVLMLCQIVSRFWDKEKPLIKMSIHRPQYSIPIKLLQLYLLFTHSE